MTYTTFLVLLFVLVLCLFTTSWVLSVIDDRRLKIERTPKASGCFWLKMNNIQQGCINENIRADKTVLISDFVMTESGHIKIMIYHNYDAIKMQKLIKGGN